ncbi:hypothetical protein LTR70_005891 [Exophiala xenobiotica]|uniref:Uncharacterized protein n=1 Tax=Lithohypha guttulata TaxID=1690604 RepID=A0ABR0K727_9EURO|nr:hypothetical protein LTR24_006127 [Lithohypha guttulata]KAK5317274.1 hypothetical protein LTR70_005891 [Exophiala xenobiotica]
MSKNDRSWITLAVREITMRYSHARHSSLSLVEPLLLPYTNLQTIILVIEIHTITQNREGKDGCQYADELLNLPYFATGAERHIKACLAPSVPPCFRNLVKKATFIQYVGVVGDWARRWGPFKACVSFEVTFRGANVECTHVNSWKEADPVPPDELLRRNFRAVVNQVANLRGPPEWRNLSYPALRGTSSSEHYYL